jgi:hypothetical protein
LHVISLNYLIRLVEMPARETMVVFHKWLVFERTCTACSPAPLALAAQRR